MRVLTRVGVLSTRCSGTLSEGIWWSCEFALPVFSDRSIELLEASREAVLSYLRRAADRLAWAVVMPEGHRVWYNVLTGVVLWTPMLA